MKKSSTASRAASAELDSCNALLPPQSTSATPASSALSPLPSRGSSAGVSRPSSAAAFEFQQASEAYHEALMQKRINLVQQMQASLSDTSTVAYQTIAAYSQLLEGNHVSLRLHRWRYS